MRGLLPQPGGFEGFLMVEEVFEHDGLPTTEGDDQGASHSSRAKPRGLTGRILMTRIVGGKSESTCVQSTSQSFEVLAMLEEHGYESELGSDRLIVS
jgi:hypothetical protein